MCGIIGLINKKDIALDLVAGLKRLEYRGYDSAGVAVVGKNGLKFTKIEGKISDLEKIISKKNPKGFVGIGHTRWATHGIPSKINAHPHVDCRGEIAIAHNGIIENYDKVKQLLIKEGHKFKSETDTEVIVHLIEKYFQNGKLERAVQKALSLIEGTYGIVVVSSKDPEKIVAARKGSPLVVGVGDDRYVVASDLSAIITHTKKIFHLRDNEIVVVTPGGHKIMTLDNKKVKKELEEVEIGLEEIEKGGYQHFMLKEIFEQPVSLRNTIGGRLLLKEGKARLGGLRNVHNILKGINQIIILACGTSWHAGLIGAYMFEKFLKIPTRAELASEFRYRQPAVDRRSLVIPISQSGETADTLEALREAKKKQAKALGIVNVVGSTIAREIGLGVYIHAGPEIGVASTKAFTSQVMTLALLTLYWGREGKNISQKDGKKIAKAIEALPQQVNKILDKAEDVEDLAQAFWRHKNFLYLGRGYNYPVALEGALKLKEISYVHAEGYPAAEMKHGPIALIDPKMPVVVIATKDSGGPTYQKILSNIEEIKARQGIVIVIASEGDKEIKKKVDEVIYIPHSLAMLTPILSVIPLQLLAYYIAVRRGCSVDQPRNLAKSVTVE